LVDPDDLMADDMCLDQHIDDYNHSFY